MRPLVRFRFRRKAIDSLIRKKGYTRAEAVNVLEELYDDEMDSIVMTVAATHQKTGLFFATEFGDGAILDKILAFLNEHWDEILAIFLKLIGLV